MALGRYIVSALVGGLLYGAQLGAQAPGTITGQVVDSAGRAPLASATVLIEGTRRGTLTRDDGSFTLSAIPAGAHVLRVTRVGYTPVTQSVTVPANGTVTANFVMIRTAAVLSEVVVTGYGTQRREAITGSVSQVQADQANVGQITNVTQMVQARVAGVQMIQNSGEPGAGVQVRIRGGTSISASNDPLYVVDGVPLSNDPTTPDAVGNGSVNAQLPRNPLNAINPNDIESITVLKDASATAIYGSRGANGVILITTKSANRRANVTEYETYVGASTEAKSLGVANGDQYRSFVKSMVAAGALPASADSALGTANTNWEDAILRTGLSTNHNLAFSGGGDQTMYRASLNYFDQEGIVIGNGLKRYQGRLNATHNALDGRLRFGLNMMASRVENKFAAIENGGGFLGGLFTNMVIYNPTYPVKRADGTYYEVGTGAQDVRNPVGIAKELQDNAPENRLLGNFTGTLSLRSDLSAQTTLGVDNTNSTRETYEPRSSAIGAAYNGFARQGERSLQTLNLQQLLTYSPHFGSSELEVVGGYEYTDNTDKGFEARVQNFITDAYGVDNLAAGGQVAVGTPFSYDVESKLASFFGRANYGYANRYFLTLVTRYDGSSRLAKGHQWATFPAISASWKLSDESWMWHGPFSTMSLRAGWGKQGNQAVQPYQTQLLLRSDAGAAYPFGGQPVTGLRAAQVGNPDLKWETSTQTNIGLDYGLFNDRVTGSIDAYQKDTKDLLLTVSVPQPAVVSTQLQNIGSVRNRGFEASADAQLWAHGNRSLSGGLVLSVERNQVTSLGGSYEFINTGWISGQGQSNQYSERIMVGQPIGTFYGPKFLFVKNGKQVFQCLATSAGCTNGETTDPTEADKMVLGSANPSFTLGLRNNGNWGNFDVSWLWRGEFGGKVFNNTALVYQSKADAKQGRNFLAAALDMPDSISEPSKFSSRWVESRTFVRLQNVTLGYNVPSRYLAGRISRVYVSGDNLLLFTGYKGYDPEVFSDNGGIATRGVDYLTYPRARTFTVGARAQF